MQKTTFPCGLTQARGSFRSSVDALLLAAFGQCSLPSSCTKTRFVELGSGNGMAALALALALPEARGCGVEMQPEAVEAATHNASMLGLTSRLVFGCCNVGDTKALRAHAGEGLDLVLANPPYHRSTGRLSQEEAKCTALHAQGDSLNLFCSAAYVLLRHHGYFCCIHSPASLPTVLQTLEKQRLGVRRLLPVHTRPHARAQWVLVEARKDAATDMILLPPLTLYEGFEGEEYSSAALKFCPWLQRP